MKKVALIFGITGQDGSYLAEFLLKKKYIVHGVKRRSSSINTGGIDHIYQDPHTKQRSFILHYGDITDSLLVTRLVKQIKPDEIYNLSGQSSVGLSFEMPFDTHESISIGTLNILEVIRLFKPDLKFYNASSSECFGDTGGTRANEKTPFRPKSPYGVAKSSAFWQVSNYREAYDLHVSSGILFNHESFLRPKRFVTQKIVLSAIDIYEKKQKFLKVGNVDISRDWGWAPDYVKAIWLMMQRTKPRDFIIGSGKTHSLRDFVNEVFRYLNISKKNLKTNVSQYKRKIDLKGYKANIKDTQKILKWKPNLKFKTIIHKMINNELF